MAFALELALDDAAAATVRKLWDELAAAGFTFPPTSGANPHLSLAIWDTIDRAATERALVAFSTATAPVDVSFVRVDAFASSGTVFLAPEVDGRLLEVHARCHRHFAGVGAGAWPYYVPGVWVPHCTLAQDLDAAGVESALAISQRASLPLRGRLERAELVEFRPVRRLAAAPLSMLSSTCPT